MPMMVVAAADRLQSAPGRAMNAYRAGVDLVGLLLRISLGETPAALPEGREGVLTHLAMQALLGCAGARRHATRYCERMRAPVCEARALRRQHRRTHAGDKRTGSAAVPLAVTAALLLASPKSAVKLARGGLARICWI
jgi:hypothetical protein